MCRSTTDSLKLYCLELAGGMAVYFNSLYEFNLASKAWTELSGAMKARPPARESHGFISAGDKIYVHAGAGLGGSIVCACMREAGEYVEEAA